MQATQDPGPERPRVKQNNDGSVRKNLQVFFLPEFSFSTGPGAGDKKKVGKPTADKITAPMYIHTYITHQHMCNNSAII